MGSGRVSSSEKNLFSSPEKRSSKSKTGRCAVDPLGPDALNQLADPRDELRELQWERHRIKRGEHKVLGRDADADRGALGLVPPEHVDLWPVVVREERGPDLVARARVSAQRRSDRELVVRVRGEQQDARSRGSVVRGRHAQTLARAAERAHHASGRTARSDGGLSAAR